MLQKKIKSFSNGLPETDLEHDPLSVRTSFDSMFDGVFYVRSMPKI